RSRRAPRRGTGPPEATRLVPRRRLALSTRSDRRRARPGAARERALRRLALSVGRCGGAARGPRREAPGRRRANRRLEALPVRPPYGLGQRLRPAVPALVPDQADAAAAR